MTSRYQIVIKTDQGLEVHRFTEVHSLSCGRADRMYIPCEIVLPMDYDTTDFAEDMIIEVWRDDGDGQLVLDGETGYILKFINFYRDNNGKDKIRLIGFDALFLLDGYYINYDAGTTQADKSGVACDVIKEVIDENLANPTDTTRAINSAYFTVQADDGLGATVAKKFSRQQVLSTIQNLAEQSRNAGTWVTFDVYYSGDYPFEFRTYTDQRGADLTNLVVLTSEGEAANLGNPSLTFDYSNKRTRVYIAGKGEETERAIGSADSDDINDTAFSYREYITENFQVADQTALENEARALVEKYKAKITLEGIIIQNDGMRYGLDWNYGDKLRAQYLGYEFDCRVLGYTINYSNSGGQIVDEVIATIRGTADV